MVVCPRHGFFFRRSGAALGAEIAPTPIRDKRSSPLIASVLALLLGISTILVGSGLLGTLLGVRAAVEHFADSVTGVVMAGYFFGFVLGTYLCPNMIRRVGHIRSFAAMAALASGSAFAHALFVHPFVWGMLRIITGICQVGLYMVVESWLNERAPHEARGRVFAVYATSILAAGAVGQILILVNGTGAVLAFGLASVLFSLGLVPVALTDLAEPRPVSTPRAGIANLYRISPLGMVGSLTAGLANSAFWGMGAVFAQRSGLTQAGIAGFMTATVLGGAVLQWPIGYLSDRFDRRTVLSWVCLAGAVVAIGAFFSARVSQAALISCAFVYGGLAFSVYSLSVAHLNDHLSPPEILDATRGLLLVYGVGATVGPMAAGASMGAFGPRSLLVYFAIAYGFLGLFARRRMKVSAPIPPDRQRPFVPLARMSPEAARLHPDAAREAVLSEERIDD